MTVFDFAADTPTLSVEAVFSDVRARGRALGAVVEVLRGQGDAAR